MLSIFLLRQHHDDDHHHHDGVQQHETKSIYLNNLCVKGSNDFE